DYGHHPTEVARTLEAIRERYPKQKIWVVFQPHLASRTRALMPQFAKAFAPANRVLVADLFSSAREATDPMATRDLVAAICEVHEAARASGTLQETAQYLSQYLEPGDVVVTMGAGDVYKVRELAKGT
ncbi:MAG: cyanophycin synthetase, partial [bacterium]|nr:cyanophycin synthetase [bacterium]